MSSGEGGRQRARVGGPLPTSSSTGNLAAPPPSSPQHAARSPAAQQQAHNAQASACASPVVCGRSAAPVFTPQPPAVLTVAAAAPVVVRPRPGSATAQQPASRLVVEPPAPRSWTPSKMASGSGSGAVGSMVAGPPRATTPAEALQREMQELCCAEQPGRAVSPAATAVFVQPQRPYSGGGSSAYAAPDFRRPASTGACGTTSPHVAQRNNLVGGPGSSPARPHSTGSGGAGGHDSSWKPVQIGLGKLADLRTRLSSAGSDSSSTAVEAFTEPVDVSPVVSSSSDPCVVARRRGTAPARFAPSGASGSRRTAAEWEHACSSLLGAGDRLAALALPGPSEGVVRCYIKRSSNLLGMSAHFELRLEASDELLAVAHKRVNGAASCYDIRLSSGAHGSGSSTPSSGPSYSGGSGTSRNSSSSGGGDSAQAHVVGKLKANVMGSEYLLRGRGGPASQRKGLNAQLLAVNYKPTINHMQAAPRTISAVVPVPAAKVWDGNQQVLGQFDSLAACMDAARERQLPLAYERDLVMLHTITPHYDAVKQVHYLDFKGRVTEGSAKNLQLVHWDHNRNQLGADLVLLFGKRGAGEYALDFSYPLTPLQAFALGLSSIDTKLCCAM